MTCTDPGTRICDDCGDLVSEWAEYPSADLCLFCDAAEGADATLIAERPERLREDDPVEDDPADADPLPRPDPEQETRADEREQDAQVRFCRMVLGGPTADCRDLTIPEGRRSQNYARRIPRKPRG